MPMADQKMTVEVFRYDPDAASGAAGGGETRFDSYEVPYQSEWVVLDALNWIKDTVDGTLTYRWSCRMGVCGSCGMMVNGRPVLTCAAFLKDYYPNTIRVEPLSYFPVERDLVIDLEGFLGKLRRTLEAAWYYDQLVNKQIVQPAVKYLSALLWRNVDEAAIDRGMVDGFGRVAIQLSLFTRVFQNGRVSRYAAYVVFGAILLTTLVAIFSIPSVLRAVQHLPLGD